MNVAIVGLNQLCDVEIDRVNKPHLPLAAGELSRASGGAIVLSCLLSSLLLGWAHPILSTAALRSTLLGSALLGTAYSLPPIRLKRFPLLAAFCIMAVRGAVINHGFIAHASQCLARQLSAASPGLSLASASAPAALTRLRSLAPAAFFTAFGVVIALVKDVPDVKGDQQFGIRSFSVRLGQPAVLNLALGLLYASYAGVAAALALGAARASTAIAGARRAAIAALSVAAIRSVRRRAKHVEPSDGGKVYDLYMHLWTLFYLSYVALPFVR
jgi:homogentisate phytyltransferase/homogentisate geranylgeranyltransferase